MTDCAHHKSSEFVLFPEFLVLQFYLKLFGEKYSFDDPVCHSMHNMNRAMVQCGDPKGDGSLLDIYPELFQFKFLFGKCHQLIQKTKDLQHEHVFKRIQDAKVSCKL